MEADAFIHCRVPVATKEALRAAAQRQQLSESALLKRMIEMMLQMAGTPDAATVLPSPRTARLSRLYVRLASQDWALLRARAMARALAPATYVSVLVRAHLRDLAPLPKDDYLALRQAVAELAVLGRNLNQLTRAANQSGRVMLPAKNDLLAVLKVCEALRDHTRGLIRANVESWRSGRVETERQSV